MNYNWLWIMVICLCGCHSTEHKRVGFLITSFKIERFAKEAAYFKEHLQTYNIDVIIADADENEALQTERAKELLDSGIDLLVLIPVNRVTAAATVRLANNAGVPVIAYNRLIMNCKPTILIHSDNDFIGRNMAHCLLNELDGGDIAILAGDKRDINAQEQKAAMDQEIAHLSANKSYSIIYQSFIENWSAENAAFEMEQILSACPHLAGVIAGNDVMADAVIRVIEKHHLQQKIKVTGQDADQVAITNIQAGKQLCTLNHPYQQLAGTAADVVRSMLTDGNVNRFVNDTVFNGFIDVPTVKIQSELITKENCNSYSR
jgi:D-xylose transport system substrate-binding protein